MIPSTVRTVAGRDLSVVLAGTGRALTAALAMVVAVMGWGSLSVAPARADDPPSLTVTLRQVTPVSGRADDTVTIQGTVTNGSDRPVRAVQVHLWRSSDPITDEDSLAQTLASDPAQPIGRRMLSSEAGNIFNITDVGAQRSQAFTSTAAKPKTTFAPGESADFTVQAKVSGADSLAFSTPGAYLLGIQVRGAPEGGQNQTLGRARSLFVLGPEAAEPASHRVATVVLLNSRPSLVGGTVFADDHLAHELRGRLGEMLTLARQPGATLVVDPALVDSLTVMSKGYTVVGSTTPTTQGQQDAKDFLAALHSTIKPGTSYRGMYGTPDVALASDGGRPDLLTDAARAPAEDHLLAGLPLAVVPARGVLSQRVLQAVSRAGADVVLASNGRSSTVVQRAGSEQETMVVRPEPSLFDGGPAPTPSTTPAQVTGRLQATQLLSSGPVVSLVTTREQAQAELIDAPWRLRTPLPALVANSEETPVFEPAAEPERRTDPLWLEAVDEGAADLMAWGDMVSRKEEAQLRTRELLPQAISTTWGGNRGSAVHWLAGARAQVGSVRSSDKVGLHVVGEFVTSSAEQEIPVTISNGLDDPVKVRIEFTSENSARIDVADTPVLAVGAGDSETVKVKVVARANGEVGVTARLATPAGQPVGEPRELTIIATQAGRVGWIIIIASGAVFLAGTAMRIRQVQRERRASANVSAGVTAGTTGDAT